MHSLVAQGYIDQLLRFVPHQWRWHHPGPRCARSSGIGRETGGGGAKGELLAMKTCLFVAMSQQPLAGFCGDSVNQLRGDRPFPQPGSKNSLRDDVEVDLLRRGHGVWKVRRMPKYCLTQYCKNSLATLGLRRHPSPPHHHWSGFLASPSQALFPIPPNYNSPLCVIQKLPSVV